MSAPEAGLAAALCTYRDVTWQSNTPFEWASRDSAEAPGKSREASLLEIRHKSLLSVFIFEGCPLISLVLNAIQHRNLTLLFKIQAVPLLTISGVQGYDYNHS